MRYLISSAQLQLERSISESPLVDWSGLNHPNYRHLFHMREPLMLIAIKFWPSSSDAQIPRLWWLLTSLFEPLLSHDVLNSIIASWTDLQLIETFPVWTWNRVCSSPRMMFTARHLPHDFLHHFSAYRWSISNIYRCWSKPQKEFGGSGAGFKWAPWSIDSWQGLLDRAVYSCSSSVWVP
jgi:hypothetical protein